MPITGCGRLATFLDIDMLATRGVLLYPENAPDASLPIRSGTDVALELGGRLLLSYLRTTDVQARSRSGSVGLGASTRRVYITPTPYAPHEATSALALPFPTASRTYVVLLDPAQIPAIPGPRRVLCGYGIEYLLPNGYPAAALKLSWERVID